MAANAQVWRNAMGLLQITEISLALGTTNRYNVKFSLDAALWRQRCLPFSPLGGFLRAKGDLLSITPQGLLLDLGPLTSWP